MPNVSRNIHVRLGCHDVSESQWNVKLVVRNRPSLVAFGSVCPLAPVYDWLALSLSYLLNDEVGAPYRPIPRTIGCQEMRISRGTPTNPDCIGVDFASSHWTKINTSCQNVMYRHDADHLQVELFP